jgi:hypothetical protein
VHHIFERWLRVLQRRYLMFTDPVLVVIALVSSLILLAAILFAIRH